jgi:hypothetical protein
MDDAKIRERVIALIRLCKTLPSDEKGASEILQGMTGIIELLYGRDSSQLKAFHESASTHKANLHLITYRQSTVNLALGVLNNVLAELDSGLIGSIRKQAAAEVLTDFIALSRSALADAGGQGKNVAAVLAAAAFEDSIRRLGAMHAATVGGEKLADVLTALKSSGFLQGPQVGIAQSYLTFRNQAMHA